MADMTDNTNTADMTDMTVTVVETEVPTEDETSTEDGRRTTFLEYTGDVRGSHEGKNADWDAVFEKAKAAAGRAVFDSLCNRPGTAYVDMRMPSLSKRIKDHGNLCERHGDPKFTETNHHEHWDRDAFGRKKHWQGWKQYRYSFSIKVSVI
ncbi:hypothetical protein H2198_004073 [Neophaeococcomyces mojaviensis]|uniref:Uncharacterized protein n=1 Tax=Neophaeococcomyces mojaviensis TaxID=3383035 RepID=A0ACC3A9G2_9EURO|nr:hypothetical protein H2198_004073 [Knufia sp. JES_112]